MPHAKLAPDFGYCGGKLSRFLFAHASGGFIEKQIFWTGSERSRDADPSFVAIGKVCGPLQSLAGEPEEVERFPGALPRGGAAQAHADGGQLRVLQYREIAEQAHALKRSCEAVAADAKSRPPVISCPSSATRPSFGA